MRKDEAEIIFADAIKKCFLQPLNREHSWEKPVPGSDWAVSKELLQANVTQTF